MFHHQALQAWGLNLRHWLTFGICLRLGSKAMDLIIVMEIHQMEGEGEQFPHFSKSLYVVSAEFVSPDDFWRIILQQQPFYDQLRWSFPLELLL